jgi:hypothetical protein
MRYDFGQGAFGVVYRVVALKRCIGHLILYTCQKLHYGMVIADASTPPTPLGKNLMRPSILAWFFPNKRIIVDLLTVLFFINGFGNSPNIKKNTL